MSVSVSRWEPGPPWQVLADSKTTNGGFLLGEARIEPGVPAPGLHVHSREDESIYVIEGVMTVELGGERIELRPGDFMVLPRGIPHRFGNLTDELVRVVGVVAPTAIEGFFLAESSISRHCRGRPI